MKYFTLILFTLIVSRVFSQELIVDDSVTLRKGIYRNFEEFKFNSPSLPLNYKVSPREYKWFSTKHTTYHINITDEDSKKFGNIFGFCDGNKIYFREEYYMKDFRPKLKSKTQFEEFKFIGFLSPFESIFTDSQNRVKEIVQVFNINNEKVGMVDQKQLKKLLLNYPELLNEYSLLPRKERLKNKTIINYINKYSLKHQSGDNIFRQKMMSRTELDLFITPEITDSTINSYYDRILNYFSKNPTFTIVELKEEFYKNSQLKSIGIIVKHELCGVTPYPYRIGKWVYYNEDGTIKKEISYDICQNRIKQ